MNENQYYQTGAMAIPRPESRATFISRTYAHLCASIFAFTAIEVALFTSGLAEPIAAFLMRGSWLIVLGGFIVVSWIATRVAHNSESLGAQYMALLGFILAEAIIFVPLLYLANNVADGVIANAAAVTLIGFTALTVIVFITRKDFSFLRGVLMWGGFIALGLIVVGALGGLNLGMWFCVGMIALAGGAVLYDTSNILHHYPEDRYVGAALQLFASIALMFWYVLQLFLSRR